MKDIHRKYMKRSFEDVLVMVEDIEANAGVQIPSEIVGQMALQLYRHRIEELRMKRMADGNSEDGTPQKGLM